MVSFMDLFAGRFGDERRAKRGVFWPGELWNSKARSCAVWGATRPALKYGTVEICRPRHCSTAGLPKSMTLQLVEGRAAGPERRASEVIAPHELDFAVALNSTLEGKTDKQKNPHQEASLAWFVARLGGWSGYQRYRPAGPKTIAYGWNQFKTMSQG